MVFLFQNCDLCGQTVFPLYIAYGMGFTMSLINFGGIIFSERKPYFKPDYLINLKRERVESTGNPSI